MPRFWIGFLGIFAVSLFVVACDGDLMAGDGGAGSDSSAVDAGTTTDADAQSGTDTGTGPDSATPDVVIADGMVGVTLAVGRGGRTTISCDDGRTWIGNRIETEESVRCWGHPNNAEPECLDETWTSDSGVECPDPNPNWLECDHHSSSITGVVHHQGMFVRSAGWGTPGRTQRSADGVDWDDPVPDFERTYLGLVTLGDALVAMGTPTPYVSNDDGLTWSEATVLGWDAGHVRQATASGYGDMGTIVFITDEGMWWTGDRGVTYNGPAALPCDGRNFASSDSVTVLGGADGEMCVTGDGGQTWSNTTIADNLVTNPVWNGTAFHAWGEMGGAFVHLSSSDGATWSSEPAGEQADVALVGATPSGSFVGTNRLWNGGYENQRFFRSDDGTSWETLPTDRTAFTPGHPISKFASGQVPANVHCPGS